MSPLSIAQYLPTHQALFDVVIFDEASQIATWDAVGAIARGRQTIIVGDPKQLPPTNFFGRNDSDDDDLPEHDRDLESILDEAKASGLPTRHALALSKPPRIAHRIFELALLRQQPDHVPEPRNARSSSLARVRSNWGL
jgi:AAA domain